MGGWVRVGIVLSVLWAIGAGYWQNNNDITRASEFYNFAYSVCSKGKAAGTLSKETDCADKSWADAAPFRDPRIVDVLIAAFLPLPFFWLLAWISVGVFRWVRHGSNKSA